MIIKSQLGLKGKFRVITTDSITGEIKRTTPFYHNLIMDGADTGFNLILDRLNSDNTYTLNITHLDIGTNATAPSLSDTLTGATARTAKATGTVSGSALTFRFFFASADLSNGTYRDVKLAIDGTASVNTGRIFNRSLFGSAYVKGTNEDTTLEWIINKLT